MESKIRAKFKPRFGLASLLVLVAVFALLMPGLVDRVYHPRQITSRTTAGNGVVCSIAVGRRIHRWNDTQNQIDFVVIERNTGTGEVSLSPKCKSYNPSDDYHPRVPLELADRTVWLPGGHTLIQIENGYVRMQRAQIHPDVLDEYLASHRLDATIEGIQRFADDKSAKAEP